MHRGHIVESFTGIRNAGIASLAEHGPSDWRVTPETARLLRKLETLTTPA